MKMIINPYHHNGITLRLLDMSDIENALIWRNDENNRIWFNNTEIISPERHLAWFCEYLKKDNDFIFMILNQEGSRCGQLSIYEVNWQKRQAVFGRFLVNPLYAEQGIMKRACAVALKLVKDEFKIEELTLEVKANNSRAIHIYETCGFQAKVVTNGFVYMQIKI